MAGHVTYLYYVQSDENEIITIILLGYDLIYIYIDKKNLDDFDVNSS